MRSQESFGAYRGEFNTNEEAKAARDQRYRELKAQGYSVKRWVLKNQLVQYTGLGQPDGRVRDVYMLNVED